MNRPQSAKPGHKGLWRQSSAEDINDHNITNNQKNANRKQVKILKPNLTTHEFARILPRKIHQDKERLYSQALQLKQTLNEVVEQNIRMKTKISVLQKQKLQMNRYIENAPESMVKGNSRINIYNNKSNEKDNMIIRNLKKIVRELREEKESLQYQNQKIKKMTKYTKINELQIEGKLIIDQNKRLNMIIQQLSSRYMDQEDLVNQNQELKKYLQEEIEQKNKLKQEHDKYEEIIESLEQKMKIQNQKYANKQKKVLKDLNLQKKKCMALQRKNDDLTRQLQNLRQNQLFIEQNKKKISATIKPVVRTYSKVNTNPSHSSKQPQLTNQINKELQTKYQSVKTQNQSLQKQLKQTKQKLKNLQNDFLTKIQKSKTELYQNSLIRNSNNNKSKLSNTDSKLQQNKSNITQQSKSDQHQEDQYQGDYQEQFQTQPKNSHIQIVNKQNDDLQKLQKFKKDFQENQEQQELFSKKIKNKEKKVKQQVKGGKEKSKEKQKQKDKKKKKKTQTKQKQQVFKPNKKILAQIKQLLTYRMQSQRYPFEDLKSDIQAAQTDIFSYADLCNMLINEPFYLTTQYTQAFLQYCYEKQKISQEQTIPNTVLVTKLRKCVEDFDLMDENQQKEMIVRIAEMTSTYPRQLQIAFQNIKNGQETVARKDLIEMFQKLQLQHKYIQLIISELSLCSDDLQHLNFHGFFQRFYIEEQNDYIQNNAIEQQESEQSYKHSSRVKKQNQKKTNKVSNKHSDNEDTKKSAQFEDEQRRQDNESI